MPQSALAYAQEHWNDGVGLCAEFVSRCINAGGCSAFSVSASMLLGQLRNSGMGTEYQLALNSDMSITAANYAGKLAAGDPVFYYCPGCTDGRPYVHTVLCNGMDGNGYMKAYSHNNANNGQQKYHYSRNCPYCGTKMPTPLRTTLKVVLLTLLHLHSRESTGPLQLRAEILIAFMGRCLQIIPSIMLASTSTTWMGMRYSPKWLSQMLARTIFTRLITTLSLDRFRPEHTYFRWRPQMIRTVLYGQTVSL